VVNYAPVEVGWEEKRSEVHPSEAVSAGVADSAAVETLMAPPVPGQLVWATVINVGNGLVFRNLVVIVCNVIVAVLACDIQSDL
jgi:hypothetical protein